MIHQGGCGIGVGLLTAPAANRDRSKAAIFMGRYFRRLAISAHWFFGNVLQETAMAFYPFPATERHGSASSFPALKKSSGPPVNDRNGDFWLGVASGRLDVTLYANASCSRSHAVTLSMRMATPSSTEMTSSLS